MKAASPTDELPDWIAAAAATQTPEVSAPPMEEAPAQAEIIDQPPAAPTAPAPEKAATGKESSDERLARLAEKLTSTRRAKDADIAARFERQRAERESAQRDIEQRMEERRTSLLAPTPSTGSLRKPGTGFLGQKKKTESLAADQAKTEEKGKTQPLPKTSGLKPAAEPAAPAKATRSLARSKKTRRRKAASYNPADVLFASRQQLSNSEFDQALDGFQQLITDGQLLDEVIVELETFTDWNPGQRSFYTALGDAYMRHNQLQKAIDTYRLALNQY
jgi:tetratricopeptide (TPR) repeat protein